MNSSRGGLYFPRIYTVLNKPEGSSQNNPASMLMVSTTSTKTPNLKYTYVSIRTDGNRDLFVAILDQNISSIGIQN